VAPAFDWWSLGMMLLEKLAAGACFEGVDDRAFLIHAPAQGVPLPETLDPDVALLLRGLLARDRAKRWQWQEVGAWLDGEPVEAPEQGSAQPDETGPALALGDVEHRSRRATRSPPRRPRTGTRRSTTWRAAASPSGQSRSALSPDAWPRCAACLSASSTTISA
jgi:serine/threonine protein kinase